MRGNAGCWGSRLPGLESVKDFPCTICTSPSSHMVHYWPHFTFRSGGEVWALLLPFRHHFCCLLSPSFPLGAVLLGKYRSWSSWHDRCGEPAAGHPQHLLCSSADRRLSLRQQRRLRALHWAGRDRCCRGNRCHWLRVERKKPVALLRKLISQVVSQKMAHFTVASCNVLKELGGVVQGVINATLLTQLLWLTSSVCAVSLEPAEAHALREQDISEQSFLAQPLRDSHREMAKEVTQSRCFQSPWVSQQKCSIWLAWCSRSWWEMSGQGLKG